MNELNLVSIQNEQVVVSSRQIAKHFEKEHRNVIRDIGKRQMTPRLA